VAPVTARPVDNGLLKIDFYPDRWWEFQVRAATTLIAVIGLIGLGFGVFLAGAWIERFPFEDESWGEAIAFGALIVLWLLGSSVITLAGLWFATFSQVTVVDFKARELVVVARVLGLATRRRRWPLATVKALEIRHEATPKVDHYTLYVRLADEQTRVKWLSLNDEIRARQRAEPIADSLGVPLVFRES
jgi:hypothetical protein